MVAPGSRPTQRITGLSAAAGAWAGKAGAAAGATDGEQPSGETALDLYTTDVTGKAREGKIDPIFG
ncbi:hypothetical protein, partial [Sulfuritalea sp.]|uniref:hypothetical protein n=1 Tax=Sulfuritalea sp. TaxID=2480090 RepID=UPI001AD49C3B